MKIKVKIMSGGTTEQEMDVPQNCTYEDILEYLHINPEIVLVFRDGNPIPLDGKVTQDSIEILRVVTGG